MKNLMKNGFMTFVWISLVSIACNLGASGDTPPTLAPRITNEAVATIGYATPVPGMEFTPTPSIPPTAVATTLYTMLNQVDGDRLMWHIRQLQDFKTRHVNSADRTDGLGISAAYEYLNGEFNKIQQQSNGLFRNLSPQRFEMNFNGKKTEQKNVVGVIDGTEPGVGAIVIGAHYDSRTNELNDSTSTAPGADDNGSGVAAVIELARILSQHPTRTTVIFALFSGEEQGRYGSRAFVEKYIQQGRGAGQGIPVMVMLNLDTIGSNNDGKGNINDTEIRLFADTAHPPSYTMAQMISFIADQNNSDLKVMLQDRIDREGRWGDHMEFYKAGYPAVRFIEALEDHDKREGMDFIEYVEPSYLVKSTRTVLTIVVALADGPRPPDPRNIVVRDNGNGTRRLVWEQVPGAVGYVVALRRPGDKKFEQVFPAQGTDTAYLCDCFTASRYQSFAIAAVSAEGIMGPLSTELAFPQ
jgi:hypothetical protein